MSDKESDGPQKSNVQGWQMQNELEPEFIVGDKVQIAKGPNGKPIKLTVSERQPTDGGYLYKLKDEDGKTYRDKQGKEKFSEDEDGKTYRDKQGKEKFSEDELEHAQ